MELRLAKTAGFCFGVSRAVETVYQNIGKLPMVTYGPIIHNKIVVEDLRAKGVDVIESFDTAGGKTVVIRSHGVGSEIYAEMDKKAIHYIDCTCPYVKKIHRLAEASAKEGRKLIIAGDRRHPEVVGIQGYGGSASIVVANGVEARALRLGREEKYALVAQTTLQMETFTEIAEILFSSGLDIKQYNTICRATLDRQEEARALSAQVDIMLVLGDKSSSNSAKLYEICKKNCRNTYFIETIAKLQLNNFISNDKIGLTAGASTSPAIIKEAIAHMMDMDGVKQENGTVETEQPETETTQLSAEIKEADKEILEAEKTEIVKAETEKNEQGKNGQSFQEMLDESFVTLHTGDVVKGTVIQVTNGEVSVNLGFKSDGTIPKGEFSENPDIDPAEVVKPGDELEVFVVKVSDMEGNVTLSRKKLEMQKGYADLENAFTNKTPIRGKITEVVKGGLIASINGVRVFVPSSHASNRYVQDLTVFKGKEFDFSIIEYDRSKRRMVASRKDLAAIEEAEKKEKVFGNLEIGQRVEGVVSRIVDFGAFVDLGGVDGLIHISEMSWGRIKKVSDVLAEGDKVLVTVLDVNKKKGKISLSLKDIENDPWRDITNRFPVGGIVEGKVVRLVPFGAFVELAEGVDGLIHISQIARKHVVKPDDELQIGEIVNVKVVEVDAENKKISLSKKEADGVLTEDEQGAESESYMEEDVAVEPFIEEETATDDSPTLEESGS